MKLLVSFALIAAVAAVDFEITNNLGRPIWVGILGNANKEHLANGGFILEQSATSVVRSADDWSGRFWARTWCDSGSQHCQTGDCGNRVECRGVGGTPPASLAEITLRGNAGQDFYNISLVDGYNVKVQMEPVDGQGDCRPIRCLTEINNVCPIELQQAGGNNGQDIVACFSSCTMFDTDQYCCRDDFGQRETCNPNTWEVNSAAVFKQACPDAYSYAYDNQTSTFTCVADRYRIIFG